MLTALHLCLPITVMACFIGSFHMHINKIMIFQGIQRIFSFAFIISIIITIGPRNIDHIQTSQTAYAIDQVHRGNDRPA